MVIQVKVTAPGKAILHGEHTVVYGTKAIAISVGLYTTVHVQVRPGSDVFVSFGEVGLSHTLPLQELKDLKSSFNDNFSFLVLDNPDGINVNPNVSKLIDDYVTLKNGFTGTLRSAFEATFKAFVFIYLATFDELEPLSLTVETELPVGAGLGSSASFAVALAGGLLTAAGRTKSDNIDNDMINRWAFVSEKFVHGNPSGIDNTVATLGGAIMYQKGQPLVPLKCSDVRVLLVSTETPRSTKELVGRVAELKEKNPELHQQYMDEAIELVEKAIEELKNSGQIKPEYVEQNQVLLQNLNVSHPRLDIIVETAKKRDLRAKLTGAGGGGCAFVVLPPECSIDDVEKLKSDLTAQCDEFKFWSVPMGVSGVKIIPL
ncbi:unnamed protein product [Orchesella dallaii]|uniref:Mevalonate kinase n=1 Tax=Orchesella dallaii TaxID=48710 RepID=A0ABP1PRN4_9HEXA